MAKTYSKNNRQTCKVVQIKPINFYEMPVGKQRFIATVKKITREYNTNSIKPFVDLMYLENIKIYLHGTWVKVKYYKNDFPIIIRKKLKNLDLNVGDVIDFYALVKDKKIEFSYFEGEEPEYRECFSEPYALLPKLYKENITVEYCEKLIFENKGCFKRVGVGEFSKKQVKRLIAGSFHIEEYEDGISCYDIKRKSYKGKLFNHLSNIKKIKTATNSIRKAV